MPKHEREFVEKGISKAEYLRLEKMVEGIENIDQVRQKLGKPTFERRSIAYTGLSETAKVSISIGSKEIQISKTVHLGTASYVRGQEVPDWEIDVSILPKEVKE